jgi:4,5-dihydroxyphthalate decarboxylase
MKSFRGALPLLSHIFVAVLLASSETPPTELTTMVLKLSFACWDYDRFKAIEDGTVRPKGIDLTFLNYRVEETFFRQLRYQEFDVSELSLSSYVLTLNQENPPFIAIPVFPSRFFRHQSMYINKNSGIKTPQDLKGKRIGSPEYQMTAPVWQRGIMEEEFGVPITDVEFFVGALEGREERKSKVPHSLPPDVRVTAIKPGQNLSEMLANGELDAVFTATKPSSMGTHPDVTYLFPNFQHVEAEYYKRTKIFPIMHVIAIKRSVYEANPWIAKTLQKAFAKSLDVAYSAIRERGALRYILPWLEEHVATTTAVMGDRWWQDGFRENEHVIEKFLEYSYGQGLANRKYKAEELFAPNTLESFVL